MNNYSYEEYMNNLLGNNMYNQRKMNINPVEPYEEDTYINQTNSELEEYYPDIYKIIYPMICKRCLYINEEITEELVERITNEIYESVECDETPNETRLASTQVNVRYNNFRNIKKTSYTTMAKENDEKKEEKRQKNFLLNDLIKILVLRELIGVRRKAPRNFPFSIPIIPPRM